MPVIGVGSIIKHRRFNCKVIAFRNKVVIVQRVNSGVVLHIPYGQMPQKAVG
jgi:hypothetical protein